MNAEAGAEQRWTERSAMQMCNQDIRSWSTHMPLQSGRLAARVVRTTRDGGVADIADVRGTATVGAAAAHFVVESGEAGADRTRRRGIRSRLIGDLAEETPSPSADVSLMPCGSRLT